ncbi:hypothetical protein [Pyxidicoccus caerfyrddinensis]|uniref:hypothetical protein n=1 Tax=Pyxidicoccus caerfyrddinensis TaxID=2709663 RepID=UPI0013D99975|nr:hypothetical protein [Pyxidicoccus caerfyrddinensis]
MNDPVPAAPSSQPRLPMHRGLRTGLLVWACVALLISASGVMRFVPPFIIPMLIGGSVLAFCIACAASRDFRAAVLTVDPRLAVHYHVVRVVAGIGFLVQYERGELPGAFALQAGWGDIAVGLAAPVVAALALPADTPLKRGVVLAWSVAGLVDILWVVGNAQRMIFSEGNLLVPATLTRFPFSLLPLFVVPLVFITHGLVLARLLRRT